MAKALIVWGGWDGHEPDKVAAVLERALKSEGFAVESINSLDPFNDPNRLRSFQLIVPNWTMGTITGEQERNVCAAIRDGVGVAGCHGGMCDAFRASTEWQFMTGGQWVAHPGNATVRYTVNIRPSTDDPILAGIGDFDVISEQYYMHVDPAVRVLATTRFPTADGPHVVNGRVEMPVIWTKEYGKGRVFYSSIGHRASDVEAEPHLTIMRRGFRWAARSGG